ncbi:MtnX-like HAD-IB family phosphatase [Clostridium estertheticum]|uniref:MtnX-like HAD-IB family phosphatase n=1 Tax=Clostridium estertheticum TaxID=238834 RepID=A0A7Y3WS69_9CLOT|nr:MtnX-like HAD-IB family phosphatase [Clostridium estertheticum]NNU75645.1 MtnX-like HAD-IB family phosphatase [Clostridium estertheticum]WBL46821.1 MtnX-like HAD-IB family phosphatase [Clostridium estertheticum]
MKDFAFISDFDGTLTKKDFYKILSDTYYKEELSPIFKSWKNGEMKDREYLNYVFNNVNRNEEELLEDILNIAFDPTAIAFIDKVKAAGGDFIIISAGTNYYIDKVLEKNHIEGVDVYSNKSVFKDNGIHFDLNEHDEFYSDLYGIDKLIVVEKLKVNYKKNFYAGDSTPDLKPALISDAVFAKGKLVNLLKEKNKDFIEFENFSEIWDKLKIHL